MEIKIIMKNKYNPTNQIGYTCGIYCLEVANSIVTNNDINLEDYYNTRIKQINKMINDIK